MSADAPLSSYLYRSLNLHRLSGWRGVAGLGSTRLLIACDEPLDTSVFDRDLKLTVAGLAVDEPGVQEVVRLAVARLGISSIVVLGTTACEHFACSGHQRVRAREPRNECDRLLRGVLQQRRSFLRGQDAVRRAVNLLATAVPELPPTAVLGLLWSAAGGVYYQYDADARVFQLVTTVRETADA